MNDFFFSLGEDLLRYGADDLFILKLFYIFVGFVPMALYCLKFNRSQNSMIKNIAIQIMRLVLFYISFNTYYRYGAMNEFIQYNALLLMVYTIVVYYYWVHKELLMRFKAWVRRSVAYVFYISLVIEVAYLGYMNFM